MRSAVGLLSDWIKLAGPQCHNDWIEIAPSNVQCANCPYWIHPLPDLPGLPFWLQTLYPIRDPLHRPPRPPG